MRKEIEKLTIKKYLEMLEKKEISAFDLISEMEQEAKNLKHLNIFIEEQFDQAKKIAEKNPKVIPVGMKDLI
jgi:hypothetical protein